MEPTPDLRFYLSIHTKLRADSARYVAAVELATERERARLVALRRWADGFVGELLEHHHAEDEHLFPDLRARVPASAAVLDRLDGDHRHMDELLERWTDAAHGLTDRRRPFEAARRELLDVSIALRDHLDGHLAEEDADVLPLFLRHYSAAEFDAVQGAAVRDARKQGMTFYVPWIVDAVDGDVRERLLAEAPWPMKVLWWATRGRHARLVATAFAGVPAVPPLSTVAR
ncbi:MAG: hemerythrin domain-containing protein [Ilumatobacteraceae bacterium]